MRRLLLILTTLIFPFTLLAQEYTSGWQAYDGNNCLRKGLQYKITSKPLEEKWEHWIYFKNNFNEKISFNYIIIDKTGKSFEGRTTLKPKSSDRSYDISKSQTPKIIIERVRFDDDYGPYWTCNDFNGEYSVSGTNSNSSSSSNSSNSEFSSNEDSSSNSSSVNSRTQRTKYIEIGNQHVKNKNFKEALYFYEEAQKIEYNEGTQTAIRGIKKSLKIDTEFETKKSEERANGNKTINDSYNSAMNYFESKETTSDGVLANAISSILLGSNNSSTSLSYVSSQVEADMADLRKQRDEGHQRDLKRVKYGLKNWENLNCQELFDLYLAYDDDNPYFEYNKELSAKIAYNTYSKCYSNISSDFFKRELLLSLVDFCVEPKCKIEFLRKKIRENKLNEKIEYLWKYEDMYSIIQYTNNELTKKNLMEELTLYYNKHESKLTYHKMWKKKVKKMQKSIEKSMRREIKHLNEN